MQGNANMTVLPGGTEQADYNSQYLNMDCLQSLEVLSFTCSIVTVSK